MKIFMTFSAIGLIVLCLVSVASIVSDIQIILAVLAFIGVILSIGFFGLAERLDNLIAITRRNNKQ